MSNNAAKHAFTEMAVPFNEQKNDQGQPFNNLVDEINTNPLDPLFQRILINVFTKFFHDSVRRMIKGAPRANIPQLRTESQLPPQRGQEDSYLRHLIESRLGLETNSLFKGLNVKSNVLKNPDLIKIFITFYYTDEDIRRAGFNLKRLRFQEMEKLDYFNSATGLWKPDSALSDSLKADKKYYQQEYWDFGWLTKQPSAPADKDNPDLLNLCWGTFPANEQYEVQTGENDVIQSIKCENILELIKVRYKAWINEYNTWVTNPETLQVNSDSEVDNIIKIIIFNTPNKGALGLFVEDMKTASPATFGTWAHDTTYAPRIGSEEPPIAIQELKNLGSGYTVPSSKKVCKILENAFDCIYSDDSDYNQAVSADKNQLNNNLVQYNCQSKPKPARDKSLPNPRFMFVFGNWGGSLSPFYPSSGFIEPVNYGQTVNGKLQFLGVDHIPFYGDFSGPLFGSISPSSVWTPPDPESGKSSRLLWRDDKEHDTQDSDHIGRFASAIYDTPLWGGFMTDYVLGINTPDAPTLKAVLGDKSNNVINSIMNRLMDRQIHILRTALSKEGQNNVEPIVLLTREAHEQVKSQHLLNPWQTIRWPHHSGNNSDSFRATTLAYAYGRVERALEEIDKQTNQEHEWKWQFQAFRGQKNNMTWISSSLPTIYEWFKEGFNKSILDTYIYPNLADGKPVKPRKGKTRKPNNNNCPRRLAKDKAKTEIPNEILEQNNQLDVTTEMVFKTIRKVWLEDNLSVDCEEEWANLQGNLSDKIDEILKQRKKNFIHKTAKTVVDEVFKKISCTKEDVDAAFLLGWRKEDELIQNPNSDFDNTLLPDFSALKPLKIEIKKFEEEQARR